MTLPASGNFSLTDVVTELRTANPGRGFPISLGDADVRTLAGKSSGIVSMTDLRGKSAYVPMTVTATGDDSTGAATGTQFTASVYPHVSVTNGLGGYSYLWEIVAQDDASFTLTQQTSATAEVRHVITKFGYQGTCTLRCTVTDSTGRQVVSNNVQAIFNWSDGNSTA